MNRETESHFSYLPTINIKRSSFKRPSTRKMSFNASDLNIIYCDDVLPGDTIKMKMASLVRMQTPLFPVMDNAYMDIYFFFIPNRLLWTHWREFWGENRTTHWEQPVTYTIPQITAPASTGWDVGTIADQFGLPTGVAGISVSHLPFRGYCRVWNEWFRDENIKDPCMITEDETTVTGANSGSYVTYAEAGAKPLKVAKFHDAFTSALPSPQKGPSVNIPLGNTAPVVGTTPTNIPTGYTVSDNLQNPLVVNHISSSGALGIVADTATNPTFESGSKTIALAADLSNAIGATINQLRQAFAVQAFYEAQARGGWVQA